MKSTHVRNAWTAGSMAPRKSARWREPSSACRAVAGRSSTDENARFNGTNLAVALNGTTSNVAGTIRHELTALTSLSFDAGRVEDRFDTSPLRDADSTTAGVKVSLNPAALIRGYRTCRPPRFPTPFVDGSRLSGNDARGQSHVRAARHHEVRGPATRDVQFSYDGNRPYLYRAAGEPRSPSRSLVQ